MFLVAGALALALSIGCRDEATPPHGGSSATAVEPAPVRSGPDAKPAAPAPDPWSVPAGSSDEPPGLAATHALADKTCPTVAKPYFYRVEKAGKVSHFLGTRHLGVSLDKMPQVVKREIAAAKLAVFEVAPGDDTDPDRGDGASLADKLGAKTWTHYRELVGANLATELEHAPPAMAMILLISMYEDKLSALDGEIEKLVLAKKIPTKGLETSAFQDRVLAELLDLRMLRATIDGTKDRAQLERESVQDLGEYCAGTDSEPGMDGETRAILLAGGYTAAEIDALDDKLVYSRNRDWIPKLEPILARGGAVIVVGADHLIGDKGVIAMLQARGYQATRVAP